MSDYHGTTGGYTNHGCRCDECRAANTAYHSEWQAQRYAETRASGLPERVRHGNSAYNNWGCRCEVCRAAHNEARLGK